MNRRDFIRVAPLVAGSVLGTSCGPATTASVEQAGDWEPIRGEFDLSPALVDFSALLIASHPRAVREAIDRHRHGLNIDPTGYLQSQINVQEERVLSAAANYVGGRPQDIALTDSTTAGLALVYHGFRLRPGEEFLVPEHGYYSTQESIRLAAERSGARVRNASLFRDIQTVSAGELVDSLVSALSPSTRVVALTWVHSSTGLKLPIREMAAALADLNRGRDERERVRMCVDGVHGFGVENIEPAKVGCDFFIAGCHKWLFGPRGTGIIWGDEQAWKQVAPTVPTFMDDAVRRAWIRGEDPNGPTTGARMSPGGFKAYEHVWALAEAFEFHQNVGKAKIASRTHELARQLKEGLAAMPHVKLITPIADELSAGIVCFDVDGMTPRDVVARLRERRIVATSTPYSPTFARLTPSIRNSPAEIEMVLREIRAIKG